MTDTVAGIHDTDEGLFASGRRAMTVGLVLTVTLVASEALAVGTVMPLVARELGDLALYGWVFTAFFLGSLIGIVVVGGLLDKGGLRRPIAAGLGLFGIGLLIGGLAPSMAILVGARFLQGLGAGAIPPIAYVAIGRTLPEQLRPRMFAVLSTAWVIPGLIGPAIGGLVGELAGWRWVFLGLLPLIAVAGAITYRSLGSVPGPSAEEHETAVATTRRLPLALVLTAGTALALAGISAGEPILLVGLVIAGAALAIPAFIRLCPPGTLRLARGLPASVGLRGILTCAFFAADAYISLLLVEGKGTSAVEAGIALTAATLAWTGGAWIQARYIGRIGARRFVGAGFTLVAVSTFATAAVLAPGIPWQVAVATWLFVGLGMGLSYSPLALVMLSEAPPGGQGAATSALQLSDVLGTAIGTGVGGALIAAAISMGASEATGVAAAFVFGAVVAALGAIASARLSTGRHQIASASVGDLAAVAAADAVVGPIDLP